MDQKVYNQQLIAEFRAQRGQAGGPFEKRPLLVLTTTGARSGQRHSTPMMFVRDGERWMVIAYPFFAAHQAKITRQIPLVLLTRLAS